MFHHLMRGANRGEPALATQRAVRRPNRGEQHSQIIRNIGHRAHRRAGVAADRFLIDGHDRRQAVDKIDVRFFQLFPRILAFANVDIDACKRCRCPSA